MIGRVRRPTPMWSAILILIGAFILAGAGLAFAADSFSDVPSDHRFHKEIRALAGAGVIQGYTDGTFRPEEYVVRQQMAKMIVLATDIHTAAIDNETDPTFPDVTPSDGIPYPFDYVEEAAEAGYFKGDEAGLFKPFANITRAQLALVVVRACGSALEEPPAGYDPGFEDLPAFAETEIIKAEHNGVLSGYTDGTFRPYEPATRGHVAKMVDCSIDLMGATTPEGAVIEGTVLDVNGDGVGGATVTIEGQDVGATTDADGSFSFTEFEQGNLYLHVTAPSEDLLDGETLESVRAMEGATVSDVTITLSGRPSDAATTVGMDACRTCHAGQWEHMFAALDGSPGAAAHSRFVAEGTDHLVYPDMWPEPGEGCLPRSPQGELLMVQDPLDGEGLVNVVLTTRDGEDGREYYFKFYPEQPGGASLTEEELDGSDLPEDAIFIPVAATIGGEGNWGEGYVDPEHALPDTHPNFGEGKQRYMARIQDVPFLVDWMEENGVPLERAKQDYVCYMPVYVVQDGTVVGSDVLAPSDVGTPKFRQKSPDHWCTPDNTLSRNCAGCHATGVEIEYQDFLDDPDHEYKSVVTAFDYEDLNVTCERCHGPGSEHTSTTDPAKIISPQYLTLKAGNELCGQCHGSHAGKSERPMGIFKPPFDATYLDSIGNGFFVPGIHDLDTFYFNNDQPSLNNDWTEGTFHAWSDETHSRAHAQQLSELKRSVHFDNPYERLTCYDCHDSHDLKGGPASFVVGEYDFDHPDYASNTLCLACHATHGPFADVSLGDVAALQLDSGGTVTKDGAEVALDAGAIAEAKEDVAASVDVHMEATTGMTGADYDPTDPDMPVGSCTSCHMAQIGKLMDINDDAQYHLAFDAEGLSAVAEGNLGSHVFDIVWPEESEALVNPDPAQGHDYDVMPNSCGKCHDWARFSGDDD